MISGVVYLKVVLDEAAVEQHLPKGAEVNIEPSGNEAAQNLKELLSKYINTLDAHEQKQEAEAVRRLLNDWQGAFVKAVPKKK